MISINSTTFMLLFAILAVAFSSTEAINANMSMSSLQSVDGNASTIDSTLSFTSEFTIPEVPLMERNSGEANEVDGEEESKPSFAKKENTLLSEASKLGPTYGSCYLELNGTGDLSNVCLKQTNADNSVINVFLSPEEVKPADIGMFCSLWIKAKLCEIRSTCEKCPNEGALAEHFLKDSARQRYIKYCHNTEVTFSPLEVTLCDVTPTSKTGLIVTVVVLVLILIAQCAFICFCIPVNINSKGKLLKGGDAADGKSSSSSKGKQAHHAGAGSKVKPSKTK